MERQQSATKNEVIFGKLLIQACLKFVISLVKRNMTVGSFLNISLEIEPFRKLKFP